MNFLSWFDIGFDGVLVRKHVGVHGADTGEGLLYDGSRPLFSCLRLPRCEVRT
jgi:hypothetical protein